MSPQLYAFIMGSTGGVSVPAVEQWARRHGLSPRGQVGACYRAVSTGRLQARPLAVSTRRVPSRTDRGVMSAIFYVPPVWHREQAG